MPKDPYTAIQESLEHARPQLTALISGAYNVQQTRALLKLLDAIQDAAHNYVKSKKNKKKKDGDGDSREAEQVKIDWLDTEGVHLWNLASQVNRATPTTPEPSKDELSMVAACELPNLIIFRLTIWYYGHQGTNDLFDTLTWAHGKNNDRSTGSVGTQAKGNRARVVLYGKDRFSRAQLMKAEENPHALNSAAAALNELGELVADSDLATLHEMRLLQLHILKTRKAPEGELRIVMEDIMKLTDWTEESVLEILSQLASLIGQYPALPSQLVQTYLRLALASSAGHPYIRMIMYEGLLFMKALSPPTAGVRIAAGILDMISKDPDYQLDDKLLWNIGMFNESKERITEAAHWYQLAAHVVFKELGGENISRCFRKAALCHMKMADWTAALDLISLCPKEEASTHYLAFLAAIRQGGSLANEKGAKHILIASMRALLNALTDSGVKFDVEIETITVIRCLIRMTVMELAHAEDNEDPTKGQGQMKGIAWLYKCETSGATDPDLHFVRGSAMFACLCGKIFFCRDLPSGPDKALLLDQLLDYIPHCREALSSVKTTHPRWPVITHMRRIIDTSEVELQCESNEWTAIPPILQKSHSSGEISETSRTLEMMANILFQYEECPSHTKANDIKLYSRWMRAILRILLHRNGAEEEAESLKYAEKALYVQKSSLGKSAYPLDEIQWLVATFWNKGLEWFRTAHHAYPKQRHGARLQ
ncbi:hypothetical protein I307_05719 [Cryptococcus deuterogattii 99/473]|uniref:Protein ZIP4 homolog n=1 Tax=Cryptococcus deuterogattii Ram5 TaxID=1296110 RepID=A0A0D0VA31_9TREE|nr:hypothetical protein I313_02780 [Cryptococcus deuterogattii Ram5]KIY54958.1 hypothetical protein I307_05719 [Cryptococcus deuterogattii 99/473]